VQHQNGFTADTTGPDILKANIDWDDATFKTIKYTIEDIISEGDKVAVRLVLQGTSHENRKVTHHVITIMRFKEGKLVAGWITNDLYSLGKQLFPASETDQ
jgi:predicted ester cyclase